MVLIKIGCVKIGVYSCKLYCEKYDNYYNIYFISKQNIPKFLFPGWTNQGQGSRFYINLSADEWQERFIRLKQHTLIKLDYDSFEEILMRIAAEML